jgi:hypothetical protein
MSITYSNFFAPTVLTTSAATLFTVPATPTTMLLRGGRVRLTNTTAGPITVTAYAVPSGGSAADGNAFVKAKSVAANDYLDIDLPVMPAGAFLQALASASTSITAHMLSGSYFS